MRKVNVKLRKQSRRSAERFRPRYLLLAGNDTVSISMWRGAGVPSSNMLASDTVLLQMIKTFQATSLVCLSIELSVAYLCTSNEKWSLLHGGHGA